jgi:ankyrin repeat protein
LTKSKCFQHRVSIFAGKTALHWSASVDNEKATALLLKNNAKKDAQDSKVRFIK